ncbi:DUF1697 domain-containing protein [Frankia sp. Mgl5]|uniref:DUF1697 domain-containing protein n=1 Tax=Frankia sp. Mgl5 TaxID=2933793 RepID=UPI00200E6159|nr:DUF1697 domain-containing protein [Frankia sp. Mgl5]MCK9926651.1 DUF1697 domain-containing protein [Frankia sp. Mgl5]
MRYAALLRGINVAGKAKVRMPDLRRIFEDLGNRDIQTYLQSGNVVFSAPPEAGDAQEVAAGIRRKMISDLDVDVAILLRTGAELTEIVAASPFLDREEDYTKLHVTFLDQVPGEAAVDRFTVPAGESGIPAIIGRNVYLHCPDGYGRTRLSNVYIEKKLGTVGTTRNWKTVLRLCELAAA